MLISSPRFTILREPVWIVPFLVYNPQILNPYVYCYNNPVNWIDDNGLIPWKKAWDRVKRGVRHVWNWAKTVVTTLVKHVARAPVGTELIDPEAYKGFYGLIKHTKDIHKQCEE